MGDGEVRWGVIGTGAIARRFVDGLPYVDGASLAGVWGRNRESAATFAATGVTIAESVEELLESEIDAVYVATLPDSHGAYSLAALEAGKAVLCEKPSMMRTEELERVLAVARTRGVLFMEAMKTPFYPVYRSLQRQLLEDPIGPVRFVRAGNSLANVAAAHSSWRLEAGGGGLMGIGVYQAFLAVSWMGEVLDVQALGRLSSGGVDAFATVQTLHANGFGQIFCGLDVAGPGDAVLAGERGYATIHGPWWNAARATVRYSDGRIVELEEAVVGGGLNYETEHFCGLLREGKVESPVMTHETSVQMMRVLDRARTALGVRFP
jgi:predicted dehydrogenase